MTAGMVADRPIGLGDVVGARPLFVVSGFGLAYGTSSQCSVAVTNVRTGSKANTPRSTILGLPCPRKRPARRRHFSCVCVALRL
jgi:hypothetical protein